jgi:hypothetical protein
MAAIQAADVPTLNQNTTGTASGSVSGTASYLAKFTGTNVVGNSLIYDSGTNVGIGTTSPSNRLHVYQSGDAAAKIEGTTSAVVNFTKNAVYCGYIGVGSPGNNDIYIYNLASGAVRINNQAIYVTATNLVGVNEQSPGAQLHVTTAAAATKGLIVRGASAQSANLQEWQDSAGTALSSIDSNGNLSISHASNLKMTLTRTGAEFAALRFIDSAGSFDLNGGGDGILLIAGSSAKKILKVMGAASQTANLTEWQNSAGSVLSAIRSNGAIQPASMADSAAANNSIYYSTTASKLVYKDASGTVNNLY